MYDLHCHLLPGIDDGANHLDDSLALAAMAAADGVRGVVLTPHVHPGRWENTKAIINDLSMDLAQLFGLDIDGALVLGNFICWK